MFSYLTNCIEEFYLFSQLKDDLPLDTNPNLSKLELPEKRSFAGESAVVTGYGWNWVNVQEDKDTGLLKEVGSTYSMLRFAKVDILSTEQCNEIYKITPVTEKHVCGKVVQRNPTKHEGTCAVSIYLSTTKYSKLLGNINIY